MDLRSAVAAGLLLTIEIRTYAPRHLRQLRWGELVGGRRLWRVQAASRCWRQVRVGHSSTVAELAGKPVAAWSTADLPEQLAAAGRLATWPLRRPRAASNPAVLAAGQVA